MLDTVERGAMGVKKSEVRRHTAMMRMDVETLGRARKAASLMGMTLADYAADVLRKAADRDIVREARKLTKEAGGGRHDADDADRDEAAGPDPAEPQPPPRRRPGRPKGSKGGAK